MSKKLHQLVALLKKSIVHGSLAADIFHITADSRQVAKGSLFIALPGHQVDGHDFVTAACEKGATAILVEKAVQVPEHVTVIQVADTRLAMQLVAPYFFDYPSRKLRVIGVTGTNGKTTTTYLIRAIFQAAGYKVGLIGTIQNMINEQVLLGKNTTPDVIELQALLAGMVAAGVDYVVMEVSSHALALGRVAATEFDGGVFTNMTQDHLDFHHTFAEYIAAKAKLFALLAAPDATKSGKWAVINNDDAAAQQMLASCQCRQLTYGTLKAADLQATDISVQASGASFSVTIPAGKLAVRLKLTGVFNVYNALAAMGATLAEGMEPAVIKQALEDFTSVAGRFETISAGQDFTVIVDYAHTPDGLENVLKTARQIVKKRLIVVFGCGGDRDKGKRPLMGKVAMEYGDLIIATSDNPRSEEPLSILADIQQGLGSVYSVGKEYVVVIDRRAAIAKALQAAQADDVVIIAGKGHETYQILKDHTIHFDDREVVREIIREMK